MAGRERVVVQHRPEGVHPWTMTRDQRLQQTRRQVGDNIGSDHEQHEPGPPPEHGDHDGDSDPDEPERADPRQTLEEPVQPADAVAGNPALEVTIDPD